MPTLSYRNSKEYQRFRRCSFCLSEGFISDCSNTPVSNSSLHRDLLIWQHPVRGRTLVSKEDISNVLTLQSRLREAADRRKRISSACKGYRRNPRAPVRCMGLKICRKNFKKIFQNRLTVDRMFNYNKDKVE